MAHPRPFRFGVQCSSPPEVSAAAWRDLARRVEDLGFTRLTVSDHLDEQVAPIASLMAAGAATTTLRLGAMVFCNDYRHPAVLAKEAATLDVLSEGRFELGMGAGWMTSDYERAGLALDPAGVRIRRLEEALVVLKGLFADEPLVHHGEFYDVDGLAGTPKPTQRPHPPILVGGGGRKLLELAGRHADIIGLNPIMATGVIDASAGPDATVDATRRKIDWIRRAAGERFDSIEIQTRIHLAVVTDDRRGIAEALGAGFGLDPDTALASPHALCGTVEQICDDLEWRREHLGISSIGIGLDVLDALAPVVARLSGT